MSEELKPCPFCKREAQQTASSGLVSCAFENCPAFLLAVPADDWNRRAQPAEAEGGEVRLRRVIDELKAGFVVCQQCGDQEDTATLDCVPELEAIAAALSAVTAERDGLAAARMAYANEFAPDKNGDPDVGNVHANIRALKVERDRLRSKWARVESERDRLLSDNASLRGSCKALGEENKQLKRENKRQGRTIAAMAAKEA